MYRVSKVLNNNGVIAIEMEENQEYVLLGKGIGFGKKVNDLKHLLTVQDIH